MPAITATRAFPPRAYLFPHRQSELDQLFQTLDSPETGELSGVYRGTLFAIKGIDTLPSWLRRGVYHLLMTPLNPWRGKRFDGDHGANIWFSRSGQWAFGVYAVIPCANREEALNLDYNQGVNPALLRPILGEVRKINEGYYLARMRYRTRRSTHTLLYFTLQRDNQR